MSDERSSTDNVDQEKKMNQQIANTMIRELTPNELLAVSGGTKVCSYEVANRCYVWRDQSAWEQWVALVDFAVTNFR
jgi:hypothetical protein